MAKQEKSAAEIYREERKARLAKAAKKNQKKSINSAASKTAGKAIAILLVIALIGGICGFAVNQSGVIQKGKVAFTVGDVEVSQPEYNYYYTNAYNNVAYYAQYYSYYGMDVGLDTTAPLDEQEYNGMLGEIEDFPEDQTPTWADFVEYNAKHTIQQVKALVNEVEDKTLDEDGIAAVNEQLESLEQSAASAGGDGQRFSLNAYLRYCYGKGVSKGVVKKILEEQQLAQSVQDNKVNVLKNEYKDEQIEKEYNDNINNYSVVTLRSYTFNAETVTSGEGEDATEATTDETMAAAKKLADEFAAKATSEDAFKTLASEEEKKKETADNKGAYKEYLTDDSKTLLEDADYSAVSSDEGLAEWAFSKNTAKLSTLVVENADTGYTVYMMVEPIHKAPKTIVSYDSRHILVKFDETDEAAAAKSNDEEATTADGETTTAETTVAEKKEEVKVEPLDLSKYQDAPIYLDVTADTAKNKEAFKKAQDILQEYLDGEMTAENFGKLAKKYSDDGEDNKEAGGLYEGTKPGDFVAPYENWCSQEGRKEGDVGIVEVESSNYNGYHIIYFVGAEYTDWRSAVLDTLAEADFSEYIEEISHKDTVKIDNVSDEVEQNVIDNVNALIKKTASNSNDQAAY
ncbi:MAG: peptidylprolyl isomerase [Faecalibacterium sp.]|nr:peptidylprolyl isomerase [Ruminococcus sp.]MCM1392889.1 peptidylprolyl isomerase [Ruminococcus sp.]MCM1486617.1 peptidylprolyl isomerase [Faecalibacterium sp.]